jgi:hypothetical protein
MYVCICVCVCVRVVGRCNSVCTCYESSRELMIIGWKLVSHRWGGRLMGTSMLLLFMSMCDYTWHAIYRRWLN